MRIKELITKRGLKVSLFGVGESNIGILKYLYDKNPTIEITVRQDVYKAVYQKIPFAVKHHYFGSNALDNIDEDIIFFSPSCKREKKELLFAKKRGIILSSDAELFFELNRSDLIAITGSDGKSTTTRLVSDILNEASIPAISCGNCGRSLSSVLDSNKFPVCELSSFQLNYLHCNIPRAIITNITPNHLNWHGSFEEYGKAKMNIANDSTELIVDLDKKSTRDVVKDTPIFCATSFDHDFDELKKLVSASHYVTKDNKYILFDGAPYVSYENALRQEEHNIRNYMLSVAATYDLVSPTIPESVISTFRGLDHRAEVVLEYNGIKYINSSIDSTPLRTATTIKSLNTRCAVIIGGLGKGLSCDPLLDELLKSSVGAVLMGDVGHEIYHLMKADERFKDYPRILSDNLYDAIIIAENMLEYQIGAVVLSPAATSFDKYENYEERGKAFKAALFEIFEKRKINEKDV